MKKIRVIGDIHGQPNNYKKIIENSDASVQVGDLAFNYKFLDNVDSNNHKFFGGNHDNYDVINYWPHNLGDYGVASLNCLEFFFVRGEFSIDIMYRQRDFLMTGRVSWWQQEELSQKEMYDCLELYKSIKPQFVLTHGWPRVVADKFGNPGILKDFGFNPETFTTNTQELLQAMFNEWQPKLWIGGHLHVRKETTIGNTRFICLPEFGYCDVDENLDVTRLYTN